MTAQQENELRDLCVKLHGDNGLEFCVGLLTSVTSTDQIKFLIKDLKNRIENKKD